MRHQDPVLYYRLFREYFDGKPFLSQITIYHLTDTEDGPIPEIYMAVFKFDEGYGHSPSIDLVCDTDGTIWLSVISPPINIFKNAIFDGALRKLMWREFQIFQKKFGGKFEDFIPSVQFSISLADPDTKRFKTTLESFASALQSLIQKWRVARDRTASYISDIGKDIGKTEMKNAEKEYTHVIRTIRQTNQRDERLRSELFLNLEDKRYILKKSKTAS